MGEQLGEVKVALEDIGLTIKHYSPAAGDILVFRYPGRASPEAIEALRASCQAILRERSIAAMVLEEGMDVEVLRANDAELSERLYREARSQRMDGVMGFTAT